VKAPNPVVFCPGFENSVKTVVLLPETDEIIGAELIVPFLDVGNLDVLERVAFPFDDGRCRFKTAVVIRKWEQSIKVAFGQRGKFI